MRGQLKALRFSGAGMLFVGSVICALLAGGTVYSYLRSAVQTEGVLVVLRDLPPGAAITPDDVRVKQVPTGSAPTGAVAIAERAKLSGQRLRYGAVADSVLQYGHIIKKGSYITSKIADIGDQFRAIGLSGDIVPGVDRLALDDTLELTGVLNANNTVLTVPLGTVRVLDLPRGDKSDRGQVLVAATADQAALVALTQRSGSLTVGVVGHGMTPQASAPIRLDAYVGASSTAPGAVVPAATARPSTEPPTTAKPPADATARR